MPTLIGPPLEEIQELEIKAVLNHLAANDPDIKRALLLHGLATPPHGQITQAINQLYDDVMAATDIATVKSLCKAFVAAHP